MAIYETAADTAKKLRKALKVGFPGVKFSVTSKSYSGGSSVYVHWTDGPMREAVDVIANRFKSSTFDGMTDTKNKTGYEYEGEIYWGADYILTSRELSAEYRAMKEAEQAAAETAAAVEPDPVPVIKTYADWKGDLDDYLQVGDIVDEEMHEYFLNVLPPRTWTSELLQMGEPASSWQGRATYATFKRTAAGWMFCGDCYAGESETRPSDYDVFYKNQ